MMSEECSLINLWAENVDLTENINLTKKELVVLVMAVLETFLEFSDFIPKSDNDEIPACILNAYNKIIFSILAALPTRSKDDD